MSSDSESTGSAQSVPAPFRRRWWRESLLSAGTPAGDGLRPRRRRFRAVPILVPRGFTAPSPAGYPARIAPTQPWRLCTPWPAEPLERAEPPEWARLVRASCRVRPSTVVPPREVAAPPEVGFGQQGLGGAHQECDSKVDLELRLGF